MLNEIKKNFKNAARERLNVRGTIDLLKLMASAFLCTESVAQRLIIYTNFELLGKFGETLQLCFSTVKRDPCESNPCVNQEICSTDVNSPLGYTCQGKPSRSCQIQFIALCF